MNTEIRHRHNLRQPFEAAAARPLSRRYAVRSHCALFLLLIALFLGTASGASAERLAAIQEDGLSVSLDETAANKFVLSVNGATAASGNPDVKLLESPVRLVVELPHNGTGKLRQLPLTHPLLAALRVATEADQGKVVVELDGAVAPGYTLHGSTGGSLQLTFFLPVPAQEGSQEEAPQTEPSQPESGPSAIDPATSAASPAQDDSNRVGAYTVDGDRIRVVEIADKKTLSKPDVPELPTAPTAEPVRRLMSHDIQDDLDLRRQEISNLMKGELNYSQPEERRPKNNVLERVIPPESAARNNAPSNTMPIIAAAAVLLLGLALLSLVMLRRRHSATAASEHYTERRAPIDPRLLQKEELRRSRKIAECYRILGVKESDSFEDIKNRYKHLVKVFHEDKLASQELPDEMIQLANERFKSIQSAFETLKREKNIP